MQKNNKLITWGVGLTLLSAWVAPAFYSNDIAPSNGLTEAQLKSILDDKFDNFELAENDKTDKIFLKIFEDDAWEAEAEVLATEEWEDRDYKDVYRFIRDSVNGSKILDEDDIEYVREDESTDFDKMDAKNKDGIVTQYLKVRYEDSEGNDKKVYLTVRSDFDDGSLDEQKFSITGA